MSSWLITYDFASLMNPYLLRAAAAVTDEDTLAVVLTVRPSCRALVLDENRVIGRDGVKHFR